MSGGEHRVENEALTPGKIIKQTVRVGLAEGVIVTAYTRKPTSAVRHRVIPFTCPVGAEQGQRDRSGLERWPTQSERRGIDLGNDTWRVAPVCEKGDELVDELTESCGGGLAIAGGR